MTSTAYVGALGVSIRPAGSAVGWTLYRGADLVSMGESPDAATAVRDVVERR